jgi:hypothetical protein
MSLKPLNSLNLFVFSKSEYFTDKLSIFLNSTKGTVIMKVIKRNIWTLSLTAILYTTASQAETVKSINLADSERFNSSLKAHTIMANKDMSPELIPMSSKMLTALYSAKQFYNQFEVNERTLLDSIDLLSPDGSKHFYNATSARARATLDKLCVRLEQQSSEESIDIYELTTLAELAELQEEEDKQAYLKELFQRFSIDSQKILDSEVIKAEKTISHSDTDFVALGLSEPKIVFMLYKQGCEIKASGKQRNFNQSDRLKGLSQKEMSK